MDYWKISRLVDVIIHQARADVWEAYIQLNTSIEDTLTLDFWPVKILVYQACKTLHCPSA
eukprot:scaffold16713_cov30-Prasinocladus_malaysianus.AAC.1